MKKSLLYLSSYIPLYLVLIIKEVLIKLQRLYNSTKDYSFKLFRLFNSFEDYAIWLLIILSIISISLLRRAVKNSKKLTIQDYKVLDIENKTADFYFEYIGLYFLPCIGLSIGNLVDFFILFSIISILGIVYISNDLLYINPVLTLLGYKVYSVELINRATRKDVKIIITDCNEPDKLIGHEVKMIVSDSKYSMIFKDDQKELNGC